MSNNDKLENLEFFDSFLDTDPIDSDPINFDPDKNIAPDILSGEKFEPLKSLIAENSPLFSFCFAIALATTLSKGSMLVRKLSFIFSAFLFTFFRKNVTLGDVTFMPCQIFRIGSKTLS